MSFVINRFTAVPDALSLKEIARYMGMHIRDMDCDTGAKILQLLPQFLREINCKACWMEVAVSIAENIVHMDLLTVESRHLAENLRGCDRAIVFAASIGSGADRLCRAASVYAPSNAVIFDAMGSTAIEWLCDRLCDSIAVLYPQFSLRPRFSPGYGDLPLALQKDLLRVLDAQRQIGLTLSDSLMMIPQKSVTAIVGLKSNELNDKEVKL